MKVIRVLLVEDTEDQANVFRSSVDVFNDKNRDQLKIEYKIARSIDEANKVIDTSFDGAILDLKLGDDNEGGNKIVEKMKDAFLRIPVIFVSGWPDLVNEHPLIVKKRARADDTYESDLNLLNAIAKTGLTNIMGGRGVIEKTLNKVFLQNLLPQKNTWITYGQDDSSRTEKALLRYTLNHLLQLLDDDQERCFPEEAYIWPPNDQIPKTGSIVRKKETEEFLVVLNPACDLVIRASGVCKTDRILLVEVELLKTVQDVALAGITKSQKRQERMKNILGNNYTDYYHWLPQTNFFPGGLLNFRKLITLDKEAFDAQFTPPELQISPFFVKDIVARFSSYYARQGQPDIDFDNVINQLLA